MPIYCFYNQSITLLFVFPAEKSLVDCAYNLRAELENAAADVSGLFSKIGWGS
jgi:hypothetical protein